MDWRFVLLDMMAGLLLFIAVATVIVRKRKREEGG